MQDNNNNLVVIIEDTQTKLQSLLTTAITSNLQREVIGTQAKQLINTCLNELKNKGADSEFINKVERGFKASFLRWYNNTLKMLLEGAKKGNPIFYTSYTKITGVEPKIKGKSIIINIDGKDNFELGGVKNIRDYFTTGETGYSQMFIEDYQKRVNNEIMKIASMNVVLRDSLNRHLSVRNLAEMQIRYEEQVKDIDRLNKNGVEFVYASSHANASKRCQPWQGKLFKLDLKSFEGKPGKYDPTYTPTVKGTIDGKDYYSLADAFNHGFLGYNCRHHLIAYKKGMTPPKQYEARKVENERNKELNIRQMERQIRTAKRKAMLASNKEERKKWTEASKALQDDYWDYCKKNDYAVAEWRTRIAINEREGLKSGSISDVPNDRNMGNNYERGSLNNKNIVLKQNEDRYVFKFKAKFNWTKYYRKNKKISFSNHFTLIKDENNVIHALDRHPEILEKVPNYIDVIKNALDNPENVYVNDNDEKYGKNNLTLLIPLSKKERYMQIGVVMSNVENRIKSFRYMSIKDKKLDEFIKERNLKKIK